MGDNPLLVGESPCDDGFGALGFWLQASGFWLRASGFFEVPICGHRALMNDGSLLESEPPQAWTSRFRASGFAIWSPDFDL